MVWGRSVLLPLVTRLQIKSVFARAVFPGIHLLQFLWLYRVVVSVSCKNINTEKVHALFFYKFVSARKCIKIANLHTWRYVGMTANLFFPYTRVMLL